MPFRPISSFHAICIGKAYLPAVSEKGCLSMTETERSSILAFHRQGYGYKRISFETGISVNTIKSFLKRSGSSETDQPNANASSCLFCGAPVTQIMGRKQRKYCSDTCRNRWWSAHPELLKRTAVIHVSCPTCGSDFLAYKGAKRKFCSSACYIASRFGGTHHEP